MNLASLLGLTQVFFYIAFFIIFSYFAPSTLNLFDNEAS
jgi:hypothetical protein